jgi:hypothetical protein
MITRLFLSPIICTCMPSCTSPPDRGSSSANPDNTGHIAVKTPPPIRREAIPRFKTLDTVLFLGVSKGYISEILHYKKGLSKDVIRRLAKYFKVTQEVFNRPYKLVSPINARLKNASVMNTKKKIA